MDTVYIIKNWESAPQIKNTLYPSRKIDIEVYRNIETSSILGYGLRVLEDKKVIYAFDIESEIEGHYSLSTEEAINLLNTIGFPCEFDTNELTISEQVRHELESFKTLGYTTIVRILRPNAKLIISVDPLDAVYDNHLFNLSLCSNSKWLPLGYVSPKIINYHDYLFLTANVPTLIDSLLNS